MVTELPGTVSLQRQTADGTWETLRRSRRWWRGRTVLDLSEAAPGDVVRVVFAPRNGHIAAWVSDPLDHCPGSAGSAVDPVAAGAVRSG